MPLIATEQRALDEDGYLVLPGLLPADLRARLRRRVEQLFAEEGEAAGSGSSRSRAAAGWRTSWTRATSSAR